MNAKQKAQVAEMRAHPCPQCKAKPGSPCMRPSGHPVFGNGVHAGRLEKDRELYVPKKRRA
jgi:hypothetical protein